MLLLLACESVLVELVLEHAAWVALAVMVEYILLVPPAWRILRRARRSPALSLAVLVPPVGLWMIFVVLAFGNGFTPRRAVST